MSNRIFLGLVTHPATRFPQAAGPAGLTATLAEALRQEGWDVHTEVVSENLVAPGELDLSRRALQASFRREYEIEKSWYRFLKRGRVNAAKEATLALRYAWSRVRVASTLTTQGRERLATGRIVRLANIEAAHVELLRRADNSGAQWALILEDDAQASDVHELANSLITHAVEWSTRVTPKYVNMSKSFPLSDLGVSHLLTTSGDWDSSARLLNSEVPFTNTVCAILYRVTFLDDLNRYLADVPRDPLIPIDWKLNVALMRMHGDSRLSPSDCLTVDPAPIEQGSMVSP